MHQHATRWCATRLSTRSAAIFALHAGLLPALRPIMVDASALPVLGRPDHREILARHGCVTAKKHEVGKVVGWRLATRCHPQTNIRGAGGGSREPTRKIKQVLPLPVLRLTEQVLLLLHPVLRLTEQARVARHCCAEKGQEHSKESSIIPIITSIKNKDFETFNFIFLHI